jgi:hypothetical protein
MEKITKKRMSGKTKRNTKAVNEYTNDPFFVKKREISRKILLKAGLPDSPNSKKK